VLGDCRESCLQSTPPCVHSGEALPSSVSHSLLLAPRAAAARARSLELPPRGEALLHDVDVSEVAALQAQPAGYGWGPPMLVPALPRALRPAEPSGSARSMLRVPCYHGGSNNL